MTRTVATVTIVLGMGMLGSAVMAGRPANRTEAAGRTVQAQEATPVVRRAYEGPGMNFRGTSLSPDGRHVAISNPLAVLDLLTGNLRRLHSEDDPWNTPDR